MKIDNFLVSYNMVKPPVFEDEESIQNDQIDNYVRLNEFNNSRQSTLQTLQLSTLQSNKSYDWNAGLQGVKPQLPENLPTSSNLVISFFRNKGLTEALARGIYGNIMLESAGKLNATSRDGHDSYGLALWTGNRKLRLFSKYGQNPTLQNQLEFFWEELNTTEKSALEDLKKLTTVEGATRSIMNKFERPHKNYANFNNRLKYAMQG